MNLASGILAGSIASLAVLALRANETAAPSEARVTQIIRDVKLLPSQADARPAAVDDKVSEDTAVRTGGESRSELTFSDLAITRLGADTIFSFSKAGRTAKLDSGSILLRVPKDSRVGAINTNSVTVAITGTTVIFESDAAGNSKLITLEGRARLSLVKDPRRIRNVRAGQMLDVPPGATTLPMPVDVDLDELMKTHPLITDFAPLPSQDLIAAVAQQQHKFPPAGGQAFGRCHRPVH
jgi:ferric-dicitrate binding protein FerR (iron transport regulator)